MTLFESDADRPGGSELAIVSFASFADLQAGVVASQLFSALDITNTFSAAGFDAGWSPSAPPPDGSVPESASLALLALALFAAAGVRRRHALNRRRP